MSLSEQAVTLQCLAHELMYLGTDGSPVYSDDLSRRNGEVYRLATALYASRTKGANPEETANIYLALLMGYTTVRSRNTYSRCWTSAGTSSTRFPRRC